MDDWLAVQHGPSVLVLDNASIHRARVVSERRTDWLARGLTLCYLPPYSPELNRLELLWRHFKHCWLAPDDYHSDQILFQRINDIASKVNSECRLTSG